MIGVVGVQNIFLDGFADEFGCIFCIELGHEAFPMAIHSMGADLEGIGNLT